MDYPIRITREDKQQHILPTARFEIDVLLSSFSYELSHLAIQINVVANQIG